MLVGCWNNNETDENDNNGSSPKDPDELLTPTVGETFSFTNLEITIHDDITWTIVPQTSDDPEIRGRTVALIPITIKNTSNRVNNLNPQHIQIFAPDEEEIYLVGWAFNVNVSELIEPNQTLETVLHILYDEDGEYVLLFDNFSNARILITINITR